MAKMIFESENRDEAHRKLDELLGCTGHELYEYDPNCPVHGDELLESPKRYECREDHNREKPFQVWDGPQPPPQPPVEES